MSASHARVVPTPDRLAVLLTQPDESPREFAAVWAKRCLGEQREPAMKALHILIGTLETMSAPDLPLMGSELSDLRRVADQLVSLALIYDQDMLAEAGMKLCDFIAAFHHGGNLRHQAREAVALHVRVLRRLAPGQPPSSLEAARMLAGLDRLARHFGAEPPCNGPVATDQPHLIGGAPARRVQCGRCGEGTFLAGQPADSRGDFL